MKPKSYGDILEEIESIKMLLNLNCTELETFLYYQDVEVMKKKGFGFCLGNNAYATPEFKRAFDTLNSNEKAEYYLICLKIVNEMMNGSPKAKKNEINNEEKKVYFFQVNLKDDKNHKDWTSCFLEINTRNNTITKVSTKEQIKIRNYLIRISKSKHRKALALESSQKFVTPITLRISSKGSTNFQELSHMFKKCLIEVLKKKIQNMINGRIQADLKRKISPIGQEIAFAKRKVKTLEFLQNDRKKSLRELIQLGHSNIEFSMEEYSKISTNMLKENMLEELQKFQNFDQFRKNIFLHKNRQIVKKRYIFYINNFNLNWLTNSLFDYEKFKIWKSSLFMISLLADIPNQKTKIFHEINMYKDGNQFDFVYLRHFFNRKDIYYYIDKSISTLQYGSHDTSQSRGKIQYCIWRLKQISSSQIEVLVEAELSHISCVDIYEIISEQIGQFQKVGDCLNYRKKTSSIVLDSAVFLNHSLSEISGVEADQDPQGEYLNNLEEPEKLEDQQQFYSIVDKETLKQFSFLREQQFYPDFRKPSNMPSKNHSNLIKQKSKRYQISPFSQKTNIFVDFKDGQIFDKSQCIINDKGDLVFVNQQKIKIQAGVLKSFLARTGKNFLEGKRISDISLPIEIFGKDSNLERLCKGLSYGPLFLEIASKSISPLDRMKAVVCFALGNSLSYIQMSKPFNPILGETYQAYIDGCPVYGQQISHQPPISSLFFQGRGYLVYAQLQAKAQFGVNSVTGSNEGCYCISFDEKDLNKNLIKFNTPVGELSGIIQGDRKFNLKSKTQFLDVNHLIFLQISWGKGSNKNNIERYNDYLQGKIVKLKSKAIVVNLAKIKQSDQQEVLGYVTGRWTDKIFFDDHLLMDVNEVRPYLVTDEKHPLESNSQNRKDLKLFRQGNISASQNAKEKLEQLQRRDKKLRKQFTR